LAERLNPLERNYLDSAVASYDAGVTNSDAMPVSAGYAVARWAKHFESGRFLAGLVGRITTPVCVLGLVISALIFVPLLTRVVGAPWHTLSASFTIFAMGLTAMFTQVLIIVTFQIVNGYVYAWIAALIAAFMVGMGVSSSLIGARGNGHRWYHVPIPLAALTLLPLAANGVLRYGASGRSALGALPAEVPFVVLACVSGSLAGATFAAGSSFLTERTSRTLDAGVLAYSLDLCGATVAGLTTGFLIIPSLGISGSAHAVALFDAVILAGVLVSGMLLQRS
jgi:hypothetical protein